MIKNMILSRVREFHAKAGSFFGQKEAEKIWGETAWKLGLEVSEILGLQEGWAQFVLNGKTEKLDAAVQQATVRLQGEG